jgi:ketosteroid isomerase-like protein
MSQANVKRIKAGFAAHNLGDVDALVEVYDPDAVFETLLLGTHHGNEAIRLIYEENRKTLSDYPKLGISARSELAAALSETA